MLFIFDFIKILTKKQKYNLIVIQFLIIFMSLFELLSIVSLAPFMAIVTDPELINKNIFFFNIYQYLNFSSQNSFLIFLALIIFMLFLISLSISMYTTWKLLRFSQFVGSEISITLFKHYLEQNWLFHSQNSSNDFSRKIFEEVKRLTGGIIQPLLNVNSKIILSFVMLLAIFSYNFWIAITSTLIFGFLYLFLYIVLRKKLFENSIKISNLNKSRYNILGESFGGIKELIINNKSSFFIRQFIDSNLKFASTNSINQSMAQLPRFAMELIGIGSILLLILYLLILNNSELNQLLTILSIFALAGYKILPAFQQIFASIATIKGNLSAFYSINSELKSQLANFSKSKKYTNMNFDKKLNLNNISFFYKNKKQNVLNNITLEIKKGTKVGFVGKSGCGKSTLVDIISGLIEPNSGNIQVDNNLINKSNIFSWKNKISYIPQSIFLFDSTIIENITFESDTSKINEKRLNMCLDISSADEFIKSLPNHLNSKVGQGGVQLSGGQRQRIGIARALYQNKDILIFDESTNSLDSETEKKIITKILNNFNKKTIILITHRLESLTSLDNIFLLESSRIIASGTYKNLVQSNHSFISLLNNKDE